MADTNVVDEPVFRTNKRRKVFRKRRDSECEADGGNNVAEDIGSRGRVEEAEDGDGSVLRAQKRAGVRKNGIGFSSTEARRAAPQQESETTALVPSSQELDNEVENERFVRPAGREVVAEDKHMMAYVDSKLAEMRSTIVSPASATHSKNAAAVPTKTDLEGDACGAMAAQLNESTFQPAQARTDRVYQRPSKRPRKKRYERDEADIARDAYIDQFMQEAQVPIYDRAATKPSEKDGSGDNDAAAAEAFKAQLLADMELHRRRPPKSASAQAANAPSGPKLGGSRQQREKMRAIQEAEAKK